MGLKRPVVLVLSAPSGTGKTTIARELARRYGFHHVITATTRKPREGEREGVDYVFVDKGVFKRWIDEGNLLEYAEIYGNFYGVPKHHIYRPLSEGKNVVLTVDVRGKRSLERVFRGRPGYRFVSVFLLPPSLEELRRRLVKRGDPPQEIEKRLRLAEEEMAHAKEYDHVIVNESVERTLEKLAEILSLPGEGNLQGGEDG